MTITRISAAVVVMPGCGVLLPNWNVDWLPAYPITGVALVASGTDGP